MKSLIIAFVLSQLLDTATTCIGLSRGLEELNPILSGMSCGEVTTIKGAITAATVGGALYLKSKGRSKQAKWLLLVPTITASGAAIWNITVIW